MEALEVELSSGVGLGGLEDEAPGRLEGEGPRHCSDGPLAITQGSSSSTSASQPCPDPYAVEGGGTVQLPSLS
eukprot:2825788-Rhodomonas_salina.1